MKTMFLEVGRPSRVIETDGELESLQKLVGGYIEAVPLFDGIVMLINEEGRLRELPDNFLYAPLMLPVVGNAVFLSQKNDSFVGLSEKQINALRRILR